MPYPSRLPPLLRDAPVAVASLDVQGRFLDANPALLRAAGYDIDELRGRSFAEFLDPAAAPEARASFDALARGAIDSYREERRYRTRNGEVLDVEVHVSLMRGDDGQPAGCLAVVQDVTAHKTAIREAARRAAELRAVIESLPAAVYIGDASGIKLANQPALDQLGFVSAEELDQPVSQTAERLRVREPGSGVPMPAAATPFARALGGERVDAEVLLTHLQTGAERVQRVIAAPIRQEGRVVGAIAINLDVTDRKVTEEALQMSEARYRALVEQAPLSIQILEPGGRTLQVNKAWERLWGIRFEQLGDYNMLEDGQLVEAGLMPHIRRAFAGEAAEIPPMLYDPDRTLPDRSSHDDPRRWVRAVAYPLKGPSGEVREVVLIHEDMTQQVWADERRRRVEEERERLLVETQRARDDVAEASRVKDEFLAILSHELRTPMNAVLGWARILRSRRIGDQTEHAISVIERNAVAQARLIDDLLDLSRIITGKIRLSLEQADLGAIAEGALESVQPAADAKRIRMELRVAAGLPLITGDVQRLQQVFWNVVSNAVKFTDPDGHVLVSIDADASAVHTRVTDTGIGIAPEILPFVFDRFTQGDSSSTRAHPGLGLGLAIVRHLVELHGGTIVARSGGPGQGATFEFWLPRR